MRLTFSQLAQRFCTWAEKCRHKTTVDVYRHYFRRFVGECGNMRVDRVRPCTLTAWAKTWHASQAIVRLFRWAKDEACLIRVNPLASVQHPPKGQRCRVCTPREAARVLRGSARDLRRLLLAYRETFARPGELRAATWESIEPRGTREEMRRALQSGRAKIVLRDYKSRKRRRMPNEPRVILLSPRVGRLLCRLMPARMRPAAKIFLTARGHAWTANALRCRMRRLRASLELTRDGRGENLVPYTWRHTGATLASALGVRDRLLADVLGHTETSTTARYQHLHTAHLRRALKKVWFARHRRRRQRRKRR